MTKDNIGQSQTSVWGEKWLGGYSGLKHTASQIIPFIPKSQVYVEPFAGLARTCDESKHEQIILNDLSKYSNEYCKQNFPNAVVENMDFETTILKYDSENTFFLIDPPWRDNIYSKNDLSVLTLKTKQYYERLFYLLDSIKGKFIICTNEHSTGEKICIRESKFKYNRIRVESKDGVIFGKKTHTCLYTNIKEIGQRVT